MSVESEAYANGWRPRDRDEEIAEGAARDILLYFFPGSEHGTDWANALATTAGAVLEAIDRSHPDHGLRRHRRAHTNFEPGCPYCAGM